MIDDITNADGNDDKEIDFHHCHIILSSGEEIFARVGEFDDASYVMDFPLSVIKKGDPTSASFRVMLKKWSPFTVQRFSLLNRHSVCTMVLLSEEFVRMYESSVDQIRQADEPQEDVLDEHPDMNTSDVEVLFSGVDDSALEKLIFAPPPSSKN